jgi:Uma2 family endonuclease
MQVVAQDTGLLVAGDSLTRREFMRRWQVSPQVRRAELVGGVVYMPSPVSLTHAQTEANVAHWLGHYALHTPGAQVLAQATWYLLGDAPQPDVALRTLPELGGMSHDDGEYPAGPPELVAEVCLSSTSYDMHQKRQLYEAAGVPEYVAILLRDKEVRWHVLEQGGYQLLAAARKSVFQSQIFPGLWLNAAALLSGRIADVVRTLEDGLASPEHAAFAARLARAKRRQG